MRDLKKYVAIATLAISVFLMVGCGQNNSAADKANEELIKQQKTQEQALKDQATTTTVLPWKNINATQAENLINSDKTLQLIDVRDGNAFSNKHIPGADLLPLEELKYFYTKIDKTKPVLFYDNDGRKSAQAARFLIEHGYTDIYTLSGGMEQWTYAVEP